MTIRSLLCTAAAVATTFVASLRAEQVVFSEIMYQPPVGKPEFIEVWNITATPLDIAGWKFTDGVDFTFPAFNAGAPQAHFLQPYERIIISAADSATTRAAYPTIPVNVRVFGPWSATSGLSKDGERVEMQDKNGVIITAVEYGDSGRWPVAADGPGHSLVLADENKAIDDWRVWRASTQNGGSPGLADPAPAATGISLNEVHFNNNGAVDWIELRNNSRTTTLPATILFVSARNDFSDKVALSGSITPGAVFSVDVNFPADNGGDIKLYIIDASNHIRDAVKITRKPGRDAWQEFPAGSNDWYNSVTDTRNAQNNPARNTDIIINEMMVDPPSNQRDAEFIELYNRGAAPVDISGWKLKEGVNFTFPNGTTIPAGGYLVVGANADWLNANYPGLNALGNWDGQLANSGEVVKLDDTNGNLVNQVDYRTGGEWPEMAGGNGSSLELVNPLADNSIGGAWRDSDESNKSSFQTFTINGGVYLDQTRASTNDDEIRIWGVSDTHIILKNIVFRPTSGSGNLFVNGEVTTLNNNNDDGWQSRGTHWATFHDAQGVHLVADGHGDNKVNHIEKAAPGMTANTAYTLQFEARWVSGKGRLVAQSWDTTWGGIAMVPIPLNLGTPGAANSSAVANPPAQLTNLRHNPVVPTPGQAVTVTARVSSSTPITSVQVLHRLDNINANGAWNTTAMVDNGTAGDASANDGIYSAQINPGSFSGYSNSGAVIEFYVRATTSNGVQSELPKLGAAHPGLWVVDSQSPGTDLRRMRIVMSAYWLDALSQDSATGGNKEKFNFKYPRLANRYFPCTFIHNDSEPYYQATARKTGSPFTRATNNSLDRGRVALPGDKPFRGKGKMYWDNDGSGSTMLNNRIVRYWLYLFGVPGNQNEVCRVTRNNTTYAVRETSEVFDKDMLDRIWEDGSSGYFYELDDKFWIGDDGTTNLTREDGSWDYLTYPNATDPDYPNRPTSYHNQFTPKSREFEYDYSALIEWCRQLEINGTGLTAEQLERMADTKAMAAMAAVRGYIADWDNITMGRGKNGYFFQRPTDHKFMLIHWDSDLAFQSGRINDSVIGNLANVSTYFSRPSVKRSLNYYLTELLGAYAPNGPRLTAWLTAEENASSSYTVPTTYATWPSASLNGTTRPQVVQTFIGSALSATFAVTSPVNGATTTSNALTVIGTAPSSADRVELVDHPESTFAWTGETSWSISGIALKTGVNTLNLRMINMDGSQVGSTLVLTVNKTGNAPPVVPLTVEPTSQNVALGEILSLNANGSYDPDAAGPLSYNWSVTPTTGVTVTAPSDTTRNMVFTVPGNYTATIQVTDAGGATTTVNRAITVYSVQDFDSFGGDYLTGYTLSNLELRDNYSVDNWYSLNETIGSLVVHVGDSAPRPLTQTSPTFPLITRPVPADGDFLLSTDITLETRKFGTFFTGLWLETMEGGVPVKYAFGLENGNAIKMFRSFNNGPFSVTGQTGYSGGPLILRIHRTSLALQFQRLVNGNWTTISSRTFASPITAVNGGIFVSAGTTAPILAQSVRVAFDYLILSNPLNSADLVNNLRITEIMYNPAGAGVEFIELRNIGTTPLDITGAYFEDSFPWSSQFTFPNVVLDPGQFCIVTNDSVGFEALYGPGMLVLGGATGGLSNGGEQIVLRDPAGNIVFDFFFADSWYPTTDGQGRSLEAISNDLSQYGQASAWRASFANGGTPGSVDVAPTISDHPDGVTVNVNQPIDLSVTATGVPTPTYQWRKGGQPIDGATSSTFQIPMATEDDEGSYDVVVTNRAGFTISDPVDVLVNDPITIDDHPVSQNANPGVNVTFTVSVSGTGPFTYQWRKGEALIDGQTGPSLMVVAGDATEGVYDVVVSAPGGATATSNPATLTVNRPVVFVEHPTPQTVNPGTMVTFSVEVTGTAPFTYQWRKNTVDLEGETNPELEITAQEADEGIYDVIVSNARGPVTSDPAALSVNDPVEITEPPQDKMVTSGGSVTFTVTATGTGPLTYQWRKEGVPLEGKTEASLEISPAGPGDAGNYDVVITNIVGEEISDEATLTVNTPILFELQPKSVVVNLGGSATFSVAATGTGPIAFQWFKGTSPLDGQTGASLEIPTVTATDFGDYHVVATNVVGSVPSNIVSLTQVNFPSLVGNYQGLLAGPDFADPSASPRPGRVTATLGKTGKITGKLEYFGLKHSIKLTLDANLRASQTIIRKNTTPVTIEVHLNGVDQTLDVEVSHPGPPSAFTALGSLARIPVYTKKVPTPLAGRYTMLLEPGIGAPGDFTAPGYATVNVAKTGSTAWVGRLPDGSAIKGSAFLNSEDKAAFYSPLYVLRYPFAGQIAGPLTVTPTDVSGPLAWNKPAQAKGTHWPLGFAMLVDAIGDRYTAPANGVRIIPTPDLELQLAGPITGDAFTRMVQFSTQNRFVIAAPNPEKVKLTANRATGLVTGSYFDAGVRLTRKLQGVILQSESKARGFFQGAVTSGEWELAVP